MKFTKDDVRKELSTQIVAKGETLSLSERSINEQLDTLMSLLANDETELEDFVNPISAEEYEFTATNDNGINLFQHFRRKQIPFQTIQRRSTKTAAHPAARLRGDTERSALSIRNICRLNSCPLSGAVEILLCPISRAADLYRRTQPNGVSLGKLCSVCLRQVAHLLNISSSTTV